MIDNIKTLKSVGRPAGSKSTIPFNLGQLYQIFGPNACPPVSSIWLRENGLLDKVNKEAINTIVIPEINKTSPQIKVIDFNEDSE